MSIIDVPADSPAIASIKASIATFTNDPPDTDFQRGYLEALRNTLKEVYEAEQCARPN